MKKKVMRPDMAAEDKRELYRMILDRLNNGGISGKRKHVESDILSAHMGRPDAWWIKPDNLHLFRQYRNYVSCDPAHLVDAALAWKEGE
jgi:hypothetical protein